jgi:hypothetical protein
VSRWQLSFLLSFGVIVSPLAIQIIVLVLLSRVLHG